MWDVDLRARLVGESLVVAGGSILGGLALSPAFVGVAAGLLDLFELDAGTFAGVVVVYAVPTVVCAVVASLGAGLLVTWAVAVPYAVLAERQLFCPGGNCPPPPTMLEAIPVAAVVALFPGIAGYACATILYHRYRAVTDSDTSE